MPRVFVRRKYASAKHHNDFRLLQSYFREHSNMNEQENQPEQQPAHVTLEGGNPDVPAANDASGSPSAQATPDDVPLNGIHEDRVRDELKQVIDPELFVNIVDLGLIYEVDIQPQEDGKHSIKVEMTMTSPMCPAGPQLVGQSQSILEQLDGVGQVEIKVVMDPPWTPDRMTEDARDQLGIF